MKKWWFSGRCGAAKTQAMRMIGGKMERALRSERLCLALPSQASRAGERIGDFFEPWACAGVDGVEIGFGFEF
jgi:hypothetical protein